MTIIVIDDSPDYRQHLAYLLNNNPLVDFYQDFAELNSALAWLSINPHPDLIIMDIEMPGMNGIEGVWKIRQMGIETPIVMLTVFDQEELLIDSLRAGANGYLLKNQSESLLTGNLESILSGSLVVSSTLSGHILKHFRKPLRRDYQITSREKEVLRYLAKGNTKDQIAASLNISYHTVDSHIKSIYRKMQVQSGVQAAVKALRDRLI